MKTVALFTVPLTEDALAYALGEAEGETSVTLVVAPGGGGELAAKRILFSTDPETGGPLGALHQACELEVSPTMPPGQWELRA